MTLDPDALRVLDMARAAGGKPFETGSVAAARAAYNASFPTLQGEHEPVATTFEQQIDGPNGPIAVRIHRGIDALPSGAPALLYLHGGGWVIGNLDSHDEICRLMANLGNAVIVCPDYRLAPEHKFPAGLEDCLATLRFMAENAVDLGIDKVRIGVAGDSAGGNLAAVLALLARDGLAPPLATQILIYPNTDARQTSDSYRRFGDGFGLTATTMAWFRDHYVRTPDNIMDWRVSPLLAPDLAGVAPAFVALAGCDILADEGAAYAARLQAAGVPMILRQWPGQIHGFVSMGRHIPAARQAVVEGVTAWRHFEGSTSTG
ncbi:alpha/beta hydrolase [Mesorhizobium sp. M7A.F.Ca.US.014.04.1.1]|uniref:alpha/beta hydrolase n=5 Tax=Phyllobacteriaceae TaxID=69277 RepID=UPI0009ECFB12|nr:MULTISPECIES: alpha/beta hydrolase [Mesorhizobium]MDF3210740.1 alpha/beta hydrolase [Mesorhizobium sp. LMG15046]MDF3231768.1 alpha/beta hydrolase [Mesorhizobium sp. DSM 30133]RUU23165.1 alpha/beta hydrolase [Mesorhizobium sp. Primo-B]RUU35313.1 alpha/beta hydrolase [Mesorhizobium sp. Primo-A]RUX16172.1 alpha/beta hydrolase [Mesorhizobium sp. M7A.F.Ca.CA.002.14.1.2]